MSQLRRSALMALAVLAMCGALASAQTTSQDAGPQTASQAASGAAPNAWMLTPTPYLEWNKGVSPEIRTARDKYADQGAVGQKYPLTSPHSDAPGPGIGDGIPRSDIRPIRNRVVLTATFTEHRSVLSASEFSLYSEVTLSVDEVFEDQSTSGAVAHKKITVLASGGTVTLRSGRVLSYDAEPVQYCLQPGRKYLLVLSYHSAGDFYLVKDDWDISGGTVRPNTRPGEYRAEHGLSTLSGLTVEQLGPVLGKLLDEHQ